MEYYPPRDGWRSADPAAAGFDPGRLAAAIRFAEARESAWPRSFTTEQGDFYPTAVYLPEPPPWNAVLGPVRPRGGPSGLVCRHGRLVAEWGDTRRADMTFSVAKSYLALLAGLAVADGRIRSVDDPVRDYALDNGFASPQNRDITWRHLLQQTSEWEGHSGRSRTPSTGTARWAPGLPTTRRRAPPVPCVGPAPSSSTTTSA